MTLNPVCENVETAQGVPLTVTGVAQVSSLSQGYDTLIVLVVSVSKVHFIKVFLSVHCRNPKFDIKQLLSISSWVFLTVAF